MKAYRGDGAPSRDAINVLDCPECGSWFPGFVEMAAHMTRAHVTSPRITAAQQVLDYSAQQEREREEPEMRIPNPSRSEPRAARSNSSTAIPKADRESQRDDFNPFLKAEHIGKVGKSAELALTGNARASDSQFGQQIIAEVKHRGSLYDWGIKLNSPNHRLIEDLVGSETTKWRGKKIAITIRENLGRDYIAIDRPDAPTSKNSAKRTTKKAKRR